MAKAKTVIVLLLIAALMLNGCAFSFLGAKGNGVSAHGALSVKEGRLVGRKGENVQLRGYSTHGIGWYGEYVNKDAFESIREAGGNVFRVAMYTETDDGYLKQREKNLALVYSAIGLAKEADMYVIIDWHILDDGDPTVHQEEAVAFFSEIAAKYPDDPAVIYELCNEPNHVSWDKIKAYGESVSAAVREHSPRALIIMGTPEYSWNLNLPFRDPINDPNMIYAFHFYAGQHEDYKLLDSAIERKFPVFVSEWGVNSDENEAPALDKADEFVKYLNKNGFSWCAWSLCNKDEVFSAIKPDCEKTGGWGQEDLTDVGKLIFKYLKGGTA